MDNEPKFRSVRQSKTDEKGYCTIHCVNTEEGMAKVLRRRDQLLRTGFWVVTGYSSKDGLYTCTLQVKAMHDASITPEDFVDKDA